MGSGGAGLSLHTVFTVLHTDKVTPYANPWMPVPDTEYTADPFLPGTPLDLLEVSWWGEGRIEY